MKFTKSTTLVAAAAMLALAGCNQPANQQAGTLAGGALGAVAGGLAGTQIGSGRGRTVAIIAGTILGGAVGASIGNRLTQQDQQYAQQTTAQALNNNPPGQPAEWRNPQTGNYGYIEPTSPPYAYQAPQTQQSPYYGTSYGQPQQECRDYKQTIYVGDQYETAAGTACRQPDGTWKIVS